MSGPDLAVLAARGSGWGGAVAGIVAAAVFVVFSGWIIWQRLRLNRKDGDG
jgi:hypothetical protein